MNVQVHVAGPRIGLSVESEVAFTSNPGSEVHQFARCEYFASMGLHLNNQVGYLCAAEVLGGQLLQGFVLSFEVTRHSARNAIHIQGPSFGAGPAHRHREGILEV